MKDILTILKYTIKENITKKAFIITTVILMAMIVLICNIPNIINFFDDESENDVVENSKFVVIDSENLIGDEINSLVEAGRLMYMDIEIHNNVTEETTEKIRNNEIDAMVEILKNEETGMIKLKYTSKGSMFVDDYSIAGQFATMIKSILVNKE